MHRPRKFNKRQYIQDLNYLSKSLSRVIDGELNWDEKRRGLCSATTGLYKVLWKSGFLEQCFISWPEFSGNLSYPVPHKTEFPSYAYISFPKYCGEYGEARIRLAIHIIECINKELRSLG